MADTPATLPRRALLALPLAAIAGRALGAPPKIVTILGDSITAGLGLPAADALPAQPGAQAAGAQEEELIGGLAGAVQRLAAREGEPRGFAQRALLAEEPRQRRVFGDLRQCRHGLSLARAKSRGYGPGQGSVPGVLAF